MSTKHIVKKRFGQNFLNNDYIIHEIIKLINPKSDDFIVEIGPGLAALTLPLSEITKPLHVIEIDRDIVQILNKKFSDDNLIIHSADALKFDYSSFKKLIRVVGNLPYNISTPLLFHLASFNNITDMHFMLQKEIVERICAISDCHAYGRLSVMLQSKFICTNLLHVEKTNFTPMPKVESAIIRLKPRPEDEWQNIDFLKLNKIVTMAFNQRRKTISNSLKSLFSLDLLNELKIDSKKRAENLSVAEFIMLTRYIS